MSTSVTGETFPPPLKKRPLQELKKLVDCTTFLIRQYPKLLWARDQKSGQKIRDAFTQLYEVHLRIDDVEVDPAIPNRNLDELFSRLTENVNVQINLNADLSVDPRSWADANCLLSFHELHLLCAIVATHAPKTIFELGTHLGGTTANLAANAPQSCEIHTLDIVERKLGTPWFESQFKTHSIHRITADSLSVDLSDYQGKMDLVFVDAGHELENVMADTETALKLASGRGVILWHDFNPHFPDVVKGLRLWSEKIKIFRIRNTSFAIHIR